MAKFFIGPNIRSEKVMSVAEAAYVAGFVDGEGTVGLTRARRKESRSGFRYQPSFSVANTHMATLEQIQVMCGNGRIVQSTNSLRPHHKMLYSLRFSPNQIRHVLPQIQPYLITKVRQVEQLIEFLGINTVGRHLPADAVVRVEEIRAELRRLNHRGAKPAGGPDLIELRPSRHGNNQWAKTVH